MDLSKLPKLSSTPPPPPAAVPPPVETAPAPVAHPAAHVAPAGPEAFIDVVFGLILIYLSWPLFDWVIASVTGRPYNDPVDTTTGAAIPFVRSAFFWMNLGTAAFGAALFVVAALSARLSRRSLAIQAGALSVAAALGVLGVVLPYRAIGLQLVPLLAAAFAIYMAWSRIAVLRATR